MKLCENRLEGFGPSSNISHPLPTACFTDTVIIPLPTYLYLLLLPPLILYTHYYNTRHFNPSTAHLRLSHHHFKCLSLRTFLSALYYILIIANILMQTLEIVRLELLHAGIALLPFSYVGLGLCAIIHATDGLRNRIRGWVLANMVIWVGGVAVCIVQALGLGKQGFHGTEGRVGSKYPVSDQVIDVGVMAGVYAVIGLLEAVILWTKPRVKEEEDGEEMVFDDGVAMALGEEVGVGMGLRYSTSMK